MASAGNFTLLPPPLIVDNTHKHYDVAIVCIVLGIVGASFVVTRLWYRYKTRAFGADDYFMIPALVLYISWTIMAAYVNLNGGIGKPLWEVTLGEYAVWFKGILGSAFLYPAMSACIRTSIILFYHRIFAVLPRFYLITRVLLVLTAAYLIAFSIVPGFACTPLNKAWHALERPKYCSSYFYYDYTVGLYGTSVGLDWLLFILPIWPITRLALPTRKRYGLLVIFMFGASACIAATYKLALFIQQMSEFGHIDPRWIVTEMSRVIPPQFNRYGYTFWIPSQVEPTVAMIGTSLPALGGVFARAGERIESAFKYTFSGGSKASKSASASNQDPPSFKNYDNLETQSQKKMLQAVVGTPRYVDENDSESNIAQYEMHVMK